MLGYSEQEKQGAKWFILHGLPLTVSGMIIWAMGKILIGSTPDGLVFILKVGVAVWMLVVWYFLGKGSLIIMNRIIQKLKPSEDEK